MTIKEFKKIAKDPYRIYFKENANGDPIEIKSEQVDENTEIIGIEADVDEFNLFVPFNTKYVMSLTVYKNLPETAWIIIDEYCELKPIVCYFKEKAKEIFAKVIREKFDDDDYYNFKKMTDEEIWSYDDIKGIYCCEIPLIK